MISLYLDLETENITNSKEKFIAHLEERYGSLGKDCLACIVSTVDHLFRQELIALLESEDYKPKTEHLYNALFERVSTNVKNINFVDKKMDYSNLAECYYIYFYQLIVGKENNCEYYFREHNFDQSSIESLKLKVDVIAEAAQFIFKQKLEVVQRKSKSEMHQEAKKRSGAVRERMPKAKEANKRWTLAYSSCQQDETEKKEKLNGKSVSWREETDSKNSCCK